VRSALPLPVTAALSAVLAAAPIAGQAPPREGAIQQAALDNGLQVFVVENHTVPLATVLVAVRNGAMTQEPGDRGLAHLFEHLLFRSYKGDPTAFAQEATFLDAQFNGTTAEEVVTYYLVLPAKNVRKGMALLAQLVAKPRFNAHDLDEERSVVLDELQRSEADPEQSLARRAAELLWGPSWSRKDVGGDSGSLKAIGLERLQQTYARYYVPNNAAVMVTGDVVAADVFTGARQEFGPWSRAPDPFSEQPVPPVADLTASAAALVARPVLHAMITVQFRGPSVARDTSSTYAADALCDVLNERGSPFQRRLVDGDLFQSVRCSYSTLAHVGPFTIEARTTPAKASAALSVLLSDLDQLSQMAGLSDEDLAIARKRRRVQEALTLESSTVLAPSLAHWWASSGIDYYERYDDHLNEQRLEDLRRFAKSYLVNRPKVIAVLAPAAVIERLRPALGQPERTPGRAP